MKKIIFLFAFLVVALISTAQVDQYKVRARLYLQTDSFLIWRGDTIDFNELVSLQQLIDSLENYANQNLSSTKGGNNVAVNITGGDGTSFSIADADSSTTNELENWGTQYVTLNSDSLLRGRGTTASPLKIDTAKVATLYDLSGYQTALTTGNLTESVTGLQFDNTRQVIGGAAALSVSSGYIIPTTIEQGKWNAAYTHTHTNDQDSSATNEIQTLTYTASSRLLDISGSATDATLPLFSTTGTDPGMVSGGSSISAKFLRGDNTWQTVVTSEVDGSTTNEIQNLSKSKAGNNVTVNISGGTGTTFSVADADSSVTNEIQTLTYTASTRLLDISGSATDATLPLFSTTGTDPGLVAGGSSISAKYLRGDNTWQTVITSEVDGSTSNEIQNLSKSKAGNYVTLGISSGTGTGFSVADGDSLTTNELENWGTDYVIAKDSSLRGRGTTASPLYIDSAKIATQYDISTITNPWTADANGIKYTAGSVGIGIASQADNALYVKDSTGTYKYAAVVQNAHATGSGLKVNIPGTSNSYHIANFQGNGTDIFNFEADGSIIIRETAGDLPDTNYGSLYGSTDGRIYYRNDGGGVYDLTLGASGSATPPGGSSGDIQYNNAGAFGGFGDWDGSTLTIPGELAISSSFTTTTAQPVGISSSGYVSLYNITAPSAPGSTLGRLYMDSGDDKLYFKNSAATYDLTAGGGTGGWTDAGATVNLSTSTDDVGVGTTGDSSYKLNVLGETDQGGINVSTSASSNSAFIARNTSSSGYGFGGLFYSQSTGAAVGLNANVMYGGSDSRAINGLNTSTGSDTKYGGYFTASDGTNGTGVYANGTGYDFYAAGSGTDYGSSSSIRWKNNIVAIPDALKKLNTLRGVYFDWDKEHGGNHSVGFIAEEVGKVLPEIVNYEANGTDATGMDYSKITPLLLQAIKELSAKVDKLEKEVKTLKKRHNR